VKRSLTIRVAGGALLVISALWASACATSMSTAAASTYGSASIYRSATAYVQLVPEEAFDPAVEMLLERGDIEITELEESDNRCKAVSGDRKLTFRVIESGTRRSRLSLLVGGGHNPDANQELADTLIEQICGRLTIACEPGPGAP
jgi:hypothetical protein